MSSAQLEPIMAEFAGLDGNDAAGAEAAAGESTAVEERGEAGTRMEAAESEDEEDVFEVESILDAKIEGVSTGGGAAGGTASASVPELA